MTHAGENEAWGEFVGTLVAVDTSSPFIYLGTLQEVKEHFVIMTHVDVHDRNEGQATKEQYLIQAKRHGVNANRKKVSIRKELVVSVSKLEDVVDY